MTGWRENCFGGASEQNERDEEKIAGGEKGEAA